MKKNSLFILICIISLFSCNRDDYNDIILKAEDIISENPDSAYQILRSIKKPDILSDSTKANYWLAIGQIHYNKMNSMSQDSMLLYSLDYYKTNNENNKRLAQSFKLASLYLWWNNKKEEAEGLLLEGLGIASQRKDTTEMIHLYKGLAYITEKDNEFDKHIKHTSELIKLDNKYEYYFKYFNDLGVAYYYLDKKNSAISNIEKGLSLMDSAKVFWPYLYRNYADILIDFGEYRKAIDIQKNLLDYYTKNNSDEISFSYASISRAYLNMGSIDSAKYYLQLAEKNYPNNFNKDLSLQNYYTIQKTIIDYADKEQFEIKDIVFFSNKMFDQYMDKQKLIEEKETSQRLLEKLNLELRISKRNNQILALSILIVLIISSIIFYTYISRKRRIAIEKEEELETLKKLLSDAQISDNKKDSNFFKRILLQQLGLIKLIATVPTSQNIELLQQMSSIANKEIPVDSLLNWNDLYKIIDSIYDNFHTNLILKFGNILIDKEIQLCSLLKTGFSTKEISIVSQQSVRTIYQRKTVIRQKLKMDEKEDIIEFLEA